MEDLAVTMAHRAVIEAGKKKLTVRNKVKIVKSIALCKLLSL